MFNLIEKLSDVLSLGKAADPTQISGKLKESILLNLTDGERIVHCIKNFRAFHNAKNFKDKNMFFNSWCILTDRRLLIIRNLSYFKLFTEIHLPKISDHKVEKSEADLVITLISEATEDIIEFSKNTLGFAEEFSDILVKTLKEAADKYSLGKQQSKFCSDCGHRLS
jgi:hypothetical protein